MNAFAQLYEGRLEYARATPGSREWWKAIRKMRSARRQIRDAFSALLDIARGIYQAAADTLESLADAFPEMDILDT
jgi:hypothetical protein